MALEGLCNLCKDKSYVKFIPSSTLAKEISAQAKSRHCQLSDYYCNAAWL